jgi:hypothetical protein
MSQRITRIQDARRKGLLAAILAVTLSLLAAAPPTHAESPLRSKE